MAIIGKIRQRSALLILLIGASLLGFLIMDFTNSQFSILKGKKDYVGKINGDKITYNEFTKKFEERIKDIEDQMRAPLTDEQRNYLRTQTWDEMVNDIIFNKIYDKLGINVTPEELNDLATSAEYAAPEIRQQFRNPQTGQFDPNDVRQFLSRLDQDPEGSEPGTLRKRWLGFEKSLKENEFKIKYNNLINKGFYVPTWMAEMAYNDQNRLVDFKYVELPYSEVNPSDVKVTDEDLKKYIDEHAARFKQEEETRKMDYVTFDIIPSAADSLKTTQFLQDKRADFAKGEKPSDDSLFVRLWSDSAFDDAFYEKDKLFSTVKDSFFLLPVGSVIGPYLDGSSYKLAKISARKLVSDSVHVRDIRFSFAGITTQDAANLKFHLIDSVFAAIDSFKGDFRALAFAYSDDEMSKMKGGDLGWVKQGEKDKAINDLIFFHAQKGKLYKLPVQSENAIHLLQVIEDKPSKPAVQVAYFSKEIVPSPETERNIYGTATSFAADNQTAAKFKAAGEKLHAKTINELKKDAFEVVGLTGSARELVKWAFNAKKGDVSPVFTVEKKHVVALVEDVRPKSVPDLESLRSAITPEVQRDKEFELLSKKITDAKAANIDALGSKLGKPVEQAEKVSFARPVANRIYEPKVVATALNTAAGKLSAPIKGSSGVFVIQTLAVQEPVKTADYAMYADRMKRDLQGKSKYSQDVEKKLAKIEDDRFDFF